MSEIITAMMCERCAAENKTSRVYEQDSKLYYSKPSWNEKGTQYPRHNTRTVTYYCSNGHQWSVSEDI